MVLLGLKEPCMVDWPSWLKTQMMLKSLTLIGLSLFCPISIGDGQRIVCNVYLPGSKRGPMSPCLLGSLVGAPKTPGG